MLRSCPAELRTRLRTAPTLGCDSRRTGAWPVQAIFAFSVPLRLPEKAPQQGPGVLWEVAEHPSVPFSKLSDQQQLDRAEGTVERTVTEVVPRSDFSLAEFASGFLRPPSPWPSPTCRLPAGQLTRPRRTRGPGLDEQHPLPCDKIKLAAGEGRFLLTGDNPVPGSPGYSTPGKASAVAGSSAVAASSAAAGQNKANSEKGDPWAGGTWGPCAGGLACVFAHPASVLLLPSRAGLAGSLPRT